MTWTIQTWSSLLLIVAVVGILARRFHVPYNVGLVVAGISLAFLWPHPPVALSRELVYTGLLPPLIFGAALTLDWSAVRSDVGLLTCLASLGVGLSALITAAIMLWVGSWPVQTALLFGALMSATDPVYAIATLKEIGAKGRVVVLLEAESLLNDGTAAVLFASLLAFGLGNSIGVHDVAIRLAGNVLGGSLAGLATGTLALTLIGRTDDHLLEVTVTVVAAYGSFLLAEHFGGSGVLATLSAGILIAQVGRRRKLFTEAGEAALASTWEFVTFVGSSLVFLLVGLTEGDAQWSSASPIAALGVAAVLAGRAAAVYPICAMFHRSSQRVGWLQQHALVWGGFRGALALALALSTPDGFPGRNVIVITTFAVVAFSVVVQGLACRPILRSASQPSDDRAAT